MDTTKLQEHRSKVDGIVEQLKNRPEGKLVSIRKATPHHQIHDLSWKDKCHRVDVSSLTSILGFVQGKDRLGNECMLVVAEGQVMMRELVAACLDRGLLPHVVPEYSNFTVAGLINGEGIQSSSFRYGVFSHTICEMEIILGDSSVVTCTKDNEHKDLFSHIPESMGTLGIVTMAKIACRRATPWVMSTYELFLQREPFVERIKQLCAEKKDDFMEGLVCSRDSYLVIRSNFVPSPPPNVPKFYPQPFDTEKGDPWYYQYVRFQVLQNNFSKLVIEQDAIPTDEFLFRGMRGAWWVVEMHVNSQWLASFPSIRQKADKKVMDTLEAKGFGNNGNAMTRAEEERCTVFQDMGINLKRLDEGIQWVNDKLGVFPLWICPVDAARHLKTAEHLHGPPTDDCIVDIGIYGEPTVQPYYHNRIMPELEKFVDAPSTWGMQYRYSRESLKAERDPIRRRFKAIGTFPGMEDKIRFPDGDKKPDLDEKPIPCWRLYRDHGKYWWIKLPVLAIFALLLIALILFGVVVAAKFSLVKVGVLSQQ